MLNLLAPFVSGGLSLLGSKMQSDASAKASRLSMISQNMQNEIDREINAKNFDRTMGMSEYQFAEQLKGAQLDRDLQKEFAQNGVQWRVADAKAAGLHPLAALGMQGMASSPVSISGNVPSAPTASSNPLPALKGGDGLAAGFASFGQDLSRAMVAMATQSERNDAISNASSALSLENQALQNKLLASQIGRTSGPHVPPPRPTTRSTNMMSGQGDTPQRLNTEHINEKKHEPVVGHPRAEYAEPGHITDLGYAKTSTGYAPVPSKDVKERIEDDTVSELMWHARNRISQTFGMGLNPPAHIALGHGQKWRYDPFTQEYRQGPINPFPSRTSAVRNRNYLRTN